MAFESYKLALTDFIGGAADGYEVVVVEGREEETLGIFTKRNAAMDAAEYLAATVARGTQQVQVAGFLVAFGYKEEFVGVRKAPLPLFTRTGWYEVWQGHTVRLGRTFTLVEAQRLAERHQDATHIVTPHGDVIAL